MFDDIVSGIIVIIFAPLALLVFGIFCIICLYNICVQIYELIYNLCCEYRRRNNLEYNPV